MTLTLSVTVYVECLHCMTSKTESVKIRTGRCRVTDIDREGETSATKVYYIVQYTWRWGERRGRQTDNVELDESGVCQAQKRGWEGRRSGQV